MIYHSTKSDDYLWWLILRGKKRKNLKHTKKVPLIFNGRNIYSMFLVASLFFFESVTSLLFSWLRCHGIFVLYGNWCKVQLLLCALFFIFKIETVCGKLRPHKYSSSSNSTCKLTMV